MSLGERLKARRKQLRLSQSDLADAVGSKQAVISDLEPGITQSPAADTLVRIATVLQVQPQYLLFGQGGVLPPEEELRTLPKTRETEDELAVLRIYRGLSGSHKDALVTIARALRDAERVDRAPNSSATGAAA